MTKAFQDTSIMQGVVEFSTDTGTEWRFVRESKGIYARYAKHGNAYVFDGRTTITGKATPNKLWAAS